MGKAAQYDLRGAETLSSFSTELSHPPDWSPREFEFRPRTGPPTKASSSFESGGSRDLQCNSPFRSTADILFSAESGDGSGGCHRHQLRWQCFHDARPKHGHSEGIYQRSAELHAAQWQ